MKPVLSVCLNPTIDVSSEVRRVLPTRKLRTHNQHQHAGGGGVNVARVIHELGGEALLLLLSGGATGALLEDAVQRLNIELDLIVVKAPTRIAFMIHESETNLEYRFVPEGEPVSAEEINLALRRVHEFRGDFVVASGSLPPGVPTDVYAEMARIVVRNGGRFVLDTSGEALLKAFEGGNLFMAKPSLSELQTLSGEAFSESDAGRKAREFVLAGKAEYVAVSLGDKGAVLAHREGVVSLPSPKVEVKSAVGAGDSFVAGFVYALANGFTAENAFRMAVAAGAATAMTEGTELCHRTDVERLFREIGAPQG